MDKIFIHGLKLQAIIGVYEQERHARQPLLMDIEFTVNTQAAIASDQISHAIDYDLLTQQVQQWTAASRFRLIETMADFLANKLLAEFPVQSVLLRLRKFPKTVDADCVGVVVERDLAVVN